MGCDCVKLKDFRKISELTVVPSYGCQFGCTYCFVEDDSPSPVMTRETLDRAIDFFIPDKVDKEPRVWFFGGEPLLHKGLLKHGAERAKSVAERHGMAVTVGATTNGQHLDEDFARWCVENGFRLLISYDGHRNQRVFRGRAGRREEDAATVEDNIRRLFSLRGGKAIAPTAVLQVPPGGASGLYEEVMSAFDLGFTTVALNRVNGKAGTYSEEDLEDLHVELGRLARFVLEEKESGDEGMLRGRLLFLNGFRFEFMEYLSGKKRLKYRFYFCSEKGELIFRYDNAPHHHHEVQKSPCHKHVKGGTAPSGRVSLIEAFDEAERFILKK